MEGGEIKDRIDTMSYVQMFRLWRFAKVGEPLFQGETGDYFSEVMNKKRNALPSGEHTRISKQLGWEG